MPSAVEKCPLQLGEHILFIFMEPTGTRARLMSNSVVSGSENVNIYYGDQPPEDKFLIVYK